jgi:hypothetical protein
VTFTTPITSGRSSQRSACPPGRATRGVWMMRPGEGEQVASVAPVIENGGLAEGAELED